MAPKSTTILSQQHKPAAAEEIVNNLQVDSIKPGNTHLAPPKDRSPSCVSSVGDATCSTKGTDVDQESLMADQHPPSNYYGYYYPGYDTSSVELDDQGYYVSGDGLEIQYPVMQGENGSLVYYMPSYQPGYVQYNPYSPGATVGIDGQYLNQQSYFLSPMSPQPIASPGYLPISIPYGSEIMPSYVWDPSLQAEDVYQGHGYGGVPSHPGFSPSFSVTSHTYARSKSMPFSKANNAETKKSLPVLSDIPSVPGFTNDLKTMNKGNAVLANTYLSISKYTASNQGKSGLLYPNSSLNTKPNALGLSGIEKLKKRGKANGIGEFDLLNEQNHAPQTNITKNVLSCGAEPAGSPVSKGIDSNENSAAALIRRDQYNVTDFPSKYDHALFFVIKSYSEDDIHKSIKYNVWASTPNGNKRLDSAYQDAQETIGQKGSKCPVFLFFSVNASGQFCGVAEMTGSVDFDKNMNFWQQDKWNGFFPVKWHIIKDVPNPHFRHIILENNDNKPVTNSRDTQEVRFPQGMEMLNIFKNYYSKTSILDDFPFYESRQKTMQDKRSGGPTRAPTPRLSHLQKLDDVGQVISDLQSIDLDGKKKHNELLIPDPAKA